MCNPKDEAVSVFNSVRGQNLENVFPQSFIENFPPSAVRQGHCLACGRPLSHQEMYPAGKTPRYMCNSCYEKIALCGPKQFCLTCGGALPQGQIYSQMKNPRELSYAFHPGVCKDYHFALAGIVFGIPFRVSPARLLPEYSRNAALPWDTLSLHRSASSKIIDVEPVRSLRHVKYLKLPE